MATEIERKFLVKNDSWRASVERSIVIEQFYLAVGADRSIRVRISDDERAKLTMKFGSHLPARQEYEYRIPLEDALELRPNAVGRTILKTRHHVHHAGYLYEVDVFGGELEGLIVAELETPDKVSDAQLPDWIGRELTGDQRYSNAVMALSAITAPIVQKLAG